MDEEQAKTALKEALKEWMDDKFATFGKWSMTAIAVAALGTLAYFMLLTNGWHRVGP